MLTSLFSLLLVLTGVTNRVRIQAMVVEARGALVEAWREILLVLGACVAALPIALGRYAPALHDLRIPGLLVALGLLALFATRRFPRNVETGAQSWRVNFLHLAIMALVVIGAFVPLQLMRFDTATDLSVMLGIDKIWFEPWANLNRPLAGIEAYLALLITPNSLWGFVIVISALKFATAWSVYEIICVLRPQQTYTALVASLLFILFPSELGRFDLWSIIYHGGVFFLFAGIALFLRSYRSERRLLLLASVACLLVSLLHYETGFPIAAFAPLLLLALPIRPALFVWVVVWWGAVGLLAARMLFYFLQPGGDNYQTVLYKHWSTPPDSLLGWVQLAFSNLIKQLSPLFEIITNFASSIQNPESVKLTLIAFVCATLVLLVAGAKHRVQDTQNRLVPWLPVLGAFIFVGLGILPFIPLPIVTAVQDYGQNPTIRYQFYAAPGQAAFWAFAVGGFATLLSDRTRRIWLVAAPALLISLAVGQSFAFQRAGGVINPDIRFQYGAKVWREVDRIITENGVPDQIVFELEPSGSSPIGWNYTALHYSCVLFGVPAVQGVNTAEGFKTRMFARTEGPAPVFEGCGRTYHIKLTHRGGATLRTVTNGQGKVCGRCVVNKRPRETGEPLPFFSPGLSPNESGRH